MNLLCCIIIIVSVFKSNGQENFTSECEKGKKSYSYLDFAIDIIKKAKDNFPAYDITQKKNFLGFSSISTGAKNQSLSLEVKPVDCEELLKAGNKQSGIYKIWLRNRVIGGERSVNVYCDMDTDGGGWTVIQRRGDFKLPKNYFFRDWNNYKNGFGELDKEFWLGNDNIFALTNQRLYSARFDLMNALQEKKYALYDRFWIDDEDHNYTLHIKEYSGDAGDSLTEGHDNQKFSTKDKDNDNNNGSCARQYKGAWWYNDCHSANLNGINFNGKMDSFADGINWYSFTFHNESLQSTEIKIRPMMFEI